MILQEKKQKNKIQIWPQFLDHLSKILIIGGSGSGKTNGLINLISHQPDIDELHLYAKDPYKSKYQLLISKREGVGYNHYKNSETVIQYSYDMDEIYENIEEYNPNKERKILIAFYDMVAQKISTNSNRIIY